MILSPLRSTAVVAPRAFRPEKILAPRIASADWFPAGFPADAPVDLEIGCGVGWHPIRYAEQNPSRVLVAVERTRSKFARFASRLSHHPKLPNLVPVHADAVAWVTHRLERESVSRILLLYPNPEPKAPSQRWFRMPFFSRLLEVLKPGGEILLATNELAYLEEARAWADRAWGLRLLEARALDRAHASVARSHFERKYLERGETCFELRLEKPGPGSASGS